MIKPEEQIHSLLFNNDCVVVPDFGGFIKRKHPTVIDKKHLSIKPKGQTVFFNGALTHHDGLLVNRIAEQQQITYQDALITVQQWVKNAEKTLSLHGRLKFGKLGTFFINQDGKKWFSPDPNLNFSKASYGLETLIVKVITEESTLQEEPSTSEKAITAKNSKPRRPLLKIAASIALIGLLGSAYYFWKYYPQNPFMGPKPIQQATLLGLDDTTQPQEPIPVYESTETESDTLIEIARDHSTDSNTIDYMDQGFNQVQKPELSATSEQESESVEEKALPQKYEGFDAENTEQYTILAGAFLFPNNAGKHISRMRSLGFEVDSFKPSHSRLTRIVIGTFQSPEEAETMLLNVQQHIPQAHIIDYK